MSLIDGLLDTMSDMEDASSVALLMLYGDSGVGKTVLGMQLAQTLSKKKILYVDYAQGFTTLSINPKWKPLTKNVTRMQYKGLGQLDALADALLQGAEGFTDFDTLVLDESSSFLDAEVTRNFLAKTTSVKGRDFTDSEESTIYGASGRRFSSTMSKLHMTGCHVIHLAHKRTDKENSIVVTCPKYSGAPRSKLAQSLHLMGYVTSEIKSLDGEDRLLRTVQVQPTAAISAKTRIDGLPVKVSFDDLLKAVSEFSNGERRAVQEKAPEEVEEYGAITIE